MVSVAGDPPKFPVRILLSTSCIEQGEEKKPAKSGIICIITNKGTIFSVTVNGTQLVHQLKKPSKRSGHAQSSHPSHIVLVHPMRLTTTT